MVILDNNCSIINNCWFYANSEKDNKSIGSANEETKPVSKEYQMH